MGGEGCEGLPAHFIARHSGGVGAVLLKRKKGVTSLAHMRARERRPVS